MGWPGTWRGRQLALDGSLEAGGGAKVFGKADAADDVQSDAQCGLVERQGVPLGLLHSVDQPLGHLLHLGEPLPEQCVCQFSVSQLEDVSFYGLRRLPANPRCDFRSTT